MTGRGSEGSRAYYEEEARLGVRGAPRELRATIRGEFVNLVQAEGRASIAEFGSGPGHEGAVFGEAGLRYVGVDLAVGNARLAAEQGVHVVPASVTSLPLRPSSFDAGWSMSTLMHLAPEDVVLATEEIARVLRPAAPLWVAVWGGDGSMHVDNETISGHDRNYELRTLEENRALFSINVEIEEVTVFDVGPADQDYQLFRLRTP